MISSTGLDLPPPPASDGMIAEITSLGAGLPEPGGDAAVAAGEEPPPEPHALPDAGVGWLLLHARQHMQGRI